MATWSPPPPLLSFGRCVGHITAKSHKIRFYIVFFEVVIFVKDASIDDLCSGNVWQAQQVLVNVWAGTGSCQALRFFL